MLGKTVFFSLIALLAVGYCAAPLLSHSAARRRDARGLRQILLREIASGLYERGNPVVASWLEWFDDVARSGSDRAGPHRPPTQRRSPAIEPSSIGPSSIGPGQVDSESVEHCVDEAVDRPRRGVEEEARLDELELQAAGQAVVVLDQVDPRIQQGFAPGQRRLF